MKNITPAEAFASYAKRNRRKLQEHIEKDNVVREALIDLKCHTETRLRGGRLIRLRPPPAGICDRLLLMPGGHVVFVEMKTATGRVQPLQRDFIADLTRMRIAHRVVRSLDEFMALLDQLEKMHLLEPA